jgi:hypothetical protein
VGRRVLNIPEWIPAKTETPTGFGNRPVSILAEIVHSRFRSSRLAKKLTPHRTGCKDRLIASKSPTHTTADVCHNSRFNEQILMPTPSIT